MPSHPCIHTGESLIGHHILPSTEVVECERQLNDFCAAAIESCLYFAGLGFRQNEFIM